MCFWMSGVRNATSFPQVMFIPMRMCHSFTRNSFLGLPKSRELYKDPRTYMCSDRGHVSSGQKHHFTPSTQCNGLPGTGLTSLGLRYPSLLLWVLSALLSSPQRAMNSHMPSLVWGLTLPLNPWEYLDQLSFLQLQLFWIHGSLQTHQALVLPVSKRLMLVEVDCSGEGGHQATWQAGDSGHP